MELRMPREGYRATPASEVTGMAQHSTSDYVPNGRTAEEMKDKAGETMDRVMESAEELASTAKKKASDAAQTVSDRASEMAERVQDSTVYATVCKAAREQPLATLAGAVAIGFMAGALWKLTRSQSTSERLASQFSSYAEPHLRSLRKNIWG
jgi:ElaB/YqjD/DUF883 family membrane-anchored ribosome-binding protein